MFMAVLPATRMPDAIGSTGRRSFTAILAAVLLALLAVHVGFRLLIDGYGYRIGAISATCAPLYAYVRPHFKGWLVLPLLWFVLLAVLLRRTAVLRTTTPLLFMLFLYGVTLGTIVLVAALDGGFERIVAPYTRLDLEYSGGVAFVADPLAFLRDYVSLAPRLPMHCQNHPPGAVLFLWLVSAPFGGSVAAMAWITVLIAAGMPLLVYLAARGLLTELWARRSAILLLACPSYVLFSATSMDAVFGVLLAGGIVAVIVACPERCARYGVLFLGGFCLGVAGLMTYTVAVALVWIGVYLYLAGNLRPRVLASIAAGAVLPTVGAVVLGYRPVEVFLQCLGAHHEIMRGTAHDDPVRWLALAVGNATAFGTGLGVSFSAVAVFLLYRAGSVSAHSRILWACLMTVLVAAVAPVYTLEVERIWLFLTVPFVLGVAVAASARLSEAARLTGWRFLLWTGLTQTLLIEIFLETYW